MASKRNVVDFSQTSSCESTNELEPLPVERVRLSELESTSLPATFALELEDDMDIERNPSERKELPCYSVQVSELRDEESKESGVDLSSGLHSYEAEISGWPIPVKAETQREATITKLKAKKKEIEEQIEIELNCQKKGKLQAVTNESIASIKVNLLYCKTFNN